MNKTDSSMRVMVKVESKIKDLKLKESLSEFKIKSGALKSIFVYLSAFEKNVDTTEVKFLVTGNGVTLTYTSDFFTPNSL
jgi:uncharacterized protein (DUF2344 family)